MSDREHHNQPSIQPGHITTLLFCHLLTLRRQTEAQNFTSEEGTEFWGLIGGTKKKNNNNQLKSLHEYFPCYEDTLKKQELHGLQRYTTSHRYPRPTPKN